MTSAGLAILCSDMPTRLYHASCFRQPLFVLQTRFHSVCGHPQNPLDVGKPRGRQVIKVSEPMLEVLTPRGILHCESHLLKGHPPVIVRSQDVDARPLQGAEQAPLPGRFVVVALPVVLAIPYRLLF